MSTRQATLGERLKAARDNESRPFTQQELADRLGVSKRSVQAWECGHAIPRPSVRRRVLEFIAEQEDV